ncbi:MAG: bifunctional 3,4-dihydroxy-2-butanone-4-phosphate synthase/GTP cyclohydrolase II [Candidatus Dadabacteria bacterium]|nr:bifunctional 3,4-dihydroxy-2-butanone-4-phosphate synthase/GTP cyclohydrolase II [Candidatus Dadabacteria bacterium]MCY4047439.1 bifunctional 3,4-dihydroxy-2-butanone-4-phosphate synthase/GTP cyclohydrolase II [Candidatus Dadabacteria bacterium]
MANLHDIPEAIEKIKAGKPLILVDDQDRENEGDIVVAAEFATPEVINFMATHGKGLICLALTDENAKRIGLKLMEPENTHSVSQHTAFAVSIDAKGDDITTGISAYDRSKTVARAVADDSVPSDFIRPGHMFPLIAKKGGVLVRAGHTEASVDLARLAGLKPAAVICEIMQSDGHMARMEELAEFSKKHGIAMATIADLISYRLKRESFVKRESLSNLPTEFGVFEAFVYENQLDGSQHFALTMGDLKKSKETLVRVHSECLTSDVFHSVRCDCGPQLRQAMRMVAEKGEGVILYLRQEGRGIGLKNKIKAYHFQDKGMDTVEANEALGFKKDLRDYGIGAQILRHLGVKTMSLMTNNPRKVSGLDGFGLKIKSRVPIEIPPNENNRDYLRAKRDKLGHLLSMVD